MPTLSPRDSFDRSQQRLLDQVLILGSMAEQAVQNSVEALRRRDLNAAQQIYAGDIRLNEKRYAIETDTITLIATQQPMARDVRFLAAILEIITELERIGDYAKGISKINLLLSDEPVDPAIQADLQRMADLGLGMLRRALDAFVSQDAATARQIPAEDDQVDALYNHIYRNLMDEMRRTPDVIDRANHLMWAAHNLERMADRVTNICERIVYVSTGQMKELDASDDERMGNAR
jgi:phosphate transport system protein